MPGLFRRFFLILLLCAFAGAAPAHAEKRVALVIGNATYQHAASLKNPKNDAEALSGVLESLGFEVVKGTDLTYAAMRKTLRDYVYKLEGADVALLFYAGHGLQVNGRNYLAPVDAKLNKELDLEFEAMRVETILTHMEQAAKTNLVFLDACRDNPLARNLARAMGTRSAAIGRGLARVETGVGTLIAFATQPGNVAYDGDGVNSPFTAGLLKHIETPGMDVQLVMRRVRQEVIDATKGTQVPWDNSSLTSSFFFKARAAEEKAVAKRSSPGAEEKALELAFWQAAAEKGTRQSYQLFLEKFPDSFFADLAKDRLSALIKEDEEQAARAKAEEERRKQEAIKQAALQAERKKQEAIRKAEEEAQRKKAEEERARQLAEQERLAKEKAELEKRIAEYEAKLKAEAEAREKALAEAEARAKEDTARTKLAAADPAVSTEPVAESAITDPRILTLLLQAELKRVGCDPGEVDGNWGQQGKAALRKFTQHAKVKLSALEPSQEAIDALKDKTARVCPLACTPLEVVQGDQCVPKTCGAGQTLTRNGTCIAVAIKQPRAVPARPTTDEAKRAKDCADLSGVKGGGVGAWEGECMFVKKR